MLSFHFQQFTEILFAVFEDSRCHEMYFLFFENINQLHLFFYRGKEVVNLFFFSFTQIWILLSMRSSLFHGSGLEFIDSLCKSIELELTLGKLL